MIPIELPKRTIALPQAASHPIVVITGAALRHDRFALRMQEEFGHDVVAWLRVAPHRARSQNRSSLGGKLFAGLATIVRNPSKLRSAAGRVSSYISNGSRSRNSKRLQHEVEEQLFEEEVIRLKRRATMSPRAIDDPNSRDIVNYVASLRPYFIVTLGGPIYRKPLLEKARGVALNQHDGWCPDYKGSGTVNWALYYRDIQHLGSTVHVLTSGMDAGPIVRRSTTCLMPDDTPDSCFARTVALGTELMCEVMHEIKCSASLNVYDQPPHAGSTFLQNQLDENVRKSIARDFKSQWLSKELNRIRRF